ncbi:MAG: hypothetical protein AAGL97_09255 [Pseudomonadota bacterium]
MLNTDDSKQQNPNMLTLDEREFVLDVCSVVEDALRLVAIDAPTDTRDIKEELEGAKEALQRAANQ